MSLIGPTTLLTPLNGGTGISAKPSFASTILALGTLESGIYDAGEALNLGFGVNLSKTNTPVATSAMTAGSLQLEYSIDGNGWEVAGTPAPKAVTAEGDYFLPVANSAYRYYRVRYIPTGAVVANGTIQTMGSTAPGAGVSAIAFTPDGLFCGMAVATAVNFDLYPFAQTTTSLGTQVTATVPGGTPAFGGLECNPLPLTSTNNVYYFALAGGTTPFGAIQPVTAAGVMGTAISVSPALSGAGKDVSWHPNGKFVAFGGTTTPFVAIYEFNPASGTLGQGQSLGVTPAVGNVTTVKFSPDGNWLLVAGGTTPFVQIFPVTVDLTSIPGTPTLALGAALAAPTSLPAAAILRGAWHPSGNRFCIVANSTTINEYTFIRASINATHPLLNGASGAIGPKVPHGAVAVAPINVRYSPDGAWLAFTTATTPFLDIYAIKDQGTDHNARLTTITAITSATSYDDVAWSPNMQYIAMGGPGGAAFQQVAPWIKAVQMGVTAVGKNAS